LFIVVRKPRLDLWPPALRGRLQGRVRLYDFCRWMFPRARPRTARTSRTTGKWLGRLPSSERESPLDRGNRRSYAGSGVEHTESRHSPPGLLPVETSPRPRSLRAPRVANIARFPVWRNVGKERCRRRSTRLHCARRGRVVRRPISAKKSDVQQPEGPSVVGRSRSERGGVFPNRRAVW
jgi:hypothetical protein